MSGQDDVVRALEALSERVVLVDSSDPAALSDLHTSVESIADGLQSSGHPGAENAIATMKRLLEEVILEEAADPAANLRSVGDFVSTFQRIFRDGVPIAEATFPGETSSEAVQAAASPAPESDDVVPFELPGHADESILNEFIARQGGLLDEMEPLILGVEKGDEESLSSLRRYLHTLKGESALLGMDAIESVCHATEDLLESRPAEGSADALFAVHDWLGTAILAYAGGVTPGGEAALIEQMNETASSAGASAVPGYGAETTHTDDASIEGLLSTVREGLSGLAPDDMIRLADVHTHLEALEGAYLAAGMDAAADAAHGMTDLVTNIILEDVAQPETALRTLQQSIESLQAGGAPASAAPPAAAAPPPPPPAAPAPVKQHKVTLTEGPVYLNDGDAELLNDFVAESREHLEAADIHLLTLETTPKDEDAMSAVFRAFHTIKGVAGFLSLQDILSLAHEAENLLDKARKGDIELQGPSIDAVFAAVDALKHMVTYVSESLASGEALERPDNLAEVISMIISAANGEIPRVPVEGKDKPLGDILVESGAISEFDVEEALDAQRTPSDTPRLGELLKQNAATSSLRVERALEVQRGEPGRKIGEILVEMGGADAQSVEQAIQKQQAPPGKPKLGELLVKSGEASAQAVSQALRAQNASPRQHMQARESVKVDAERLDALVDMIGELVIAESMVAMSSELRNNVSPGLARHISQLDKITRDLQEMGTTLRMVPVKATFQKMARLVRDLGKKSGKEVNFVLHGEDTELDKTLVDKIGDPLVHMVRNAVDHGLEATPEDRVKAGKSPTGLVELSAFHKGGNIYIEIRDDGRGLDRDAIMAKAIERGIVREGETLEDRQVWNLIFEAGFSTAKKITDISGRGVGMDVVKRNIEQLRGQVEISSVKGEGTRFSIRLPLTLAIIDGMVIRCDGQRYILPTLSVQRLIHPDEAPVSTVFARDSMIEVGGTLVPLFRLGSIFGTSNGPAKGNGVTETNGATQGNGATETNGAAQGNGHDAAPSDTGGHHLDARKGGVVVVVENENKLIALVVDEVIGQQQTVIKPLGDMFQDTPGISGGAIMPDGRVGLILDVSGLARVARSGEDAGESATVAVDTAP